LEVEGENNLEKLFEAEDILREAGIEFDTGGWTANGDVLRREWKLDGIGQGYRVQRMMHTDIIQKLPRRVIDSELDYYFLDGNRETNAYFPGLNAVLLDRNLFDYPLALDYVANHEYDHFQARNSARESLKVEFLNDFLLRFSMTEQMQEVREYDRNELPDERMIFNFLPFLRAWWSPPMTILGSLYRDLVHPALQKLMSWGEKAVAGK
jgi:hypothetical protein